MDMNNVNIEEIVKQVLSGMTGNAPAAAAAPSAPAATIFRKLATTTSLLKLRDAVSVEQMLMSTKMTRSVLSR